MASDIKKQIENINSSIDWIKRHHPEHYDSRFLQLVECRRTLKKLDAAMDDNPGIAAFGKSQVGKSYLIGNLLQDNGKPFMVKAGDKVYDFVQDINPPSSEGGGVESTGVVTRFSSFKRHPERYNQDYPVLVRLFSLSDIILILADDYYNDYADFKAPDVEEVDELCQRLSDTYASRPAREGSPITADDVLNMKDYCAKHINNAQTFNSGKVAFFDRVALLIERVPENEYINVFSLLWENNANFNRLYNLLFETLRTFAFSNYVYLPIESVLHGGVRENTIMSVQCLNMLLNDDPNIVTDVYLMDDVGKMQRCAAGMSKSKICALCEEVVIKIDDNFLSSSGEYNTTYMAEDVKQRLGHTKVEMAMLRDNDLLDFPGARSRQKEAIEASSQDKVLLSCFLRGKVAYLFNKFNEDMEINILLFCHHNKDSDVTELYRLLESWVKNYVGETPEERSRRIQMTKVSPLFYIGTMFNLDLAPAENEALNSEESINKLRWNNRFDNVTNKQILHTDTVEWVNNWTREGEHFKNSYVLRDYKYSRAKYKMYSGFEPDKPGSKETGMVMSEDYYQRLRKTFTDNKFVKDFFADPALSFDVSASMGNDGALYIIDRLGVVAKNMDQARETQFDDITRKMVGRVLTIMKEYYISDDTTELLAENINKANGIFREIEFTCQEHPEYFGHLLEALQLTESASFKEVHRLIPKLSETVHDTSRIKDYELIRKRCGEFKDCKSDDDKWKVLMKTYRFRDEEEAEDYLKARGIDVQKLFKGETLKRKNSAVISDDLVTLWVNSISSVQFMNAYAGDGKVDEIAMTNLVTCVIATAQSVDLTGHIEREIADYVDILNTSNINEDLVADMIATTVSDFVIDFGYRYLNDEQKQTSRRVAEEQRLPCYDWTERERKESFDEEEMTQLFNEILSSAGRYTPAYEANYNTWLEYMYVAFIAHINVPDYDRAANDELKVIIDELKK